MHAFLPLCQNIVLADGGANRFYEGQFRNSEKVRAIIGDFDTIHPEVFDFYSQKGIPMEFSFNF